MFFISGDLNKLGAKLTVAYVFNWTCRILSKVYSH